MNLIKYASFFFAYILIMSIILLIVISGIGYKYVDSGLISRSFDINLRVLFGCGIGVGLVLFFIIWIFFGFPRFFLNYFFTFPLTILICVLYIVYTRPSKMIKYDWNIYLLIAFKYTSIKFYWNMLKLIRLKFMTKNAIEKYMIWNEIEMNNVEL